MSVYKGDDIIAGTSVGFVRELAWSAKQQITSVPFTAPKDGVIIGFCIIEGAGSTSTDYYLNGVIIGTSYHDQGHYCGPANLTIPVKTGDVFSAAEWYLPNSTLWFVPYEDSQVSDITTVTPEYIRRQNVLSEYEDFTISTNSASPTVMPYDGFITLRVAAGSDTIYNLYINGKAFGMTATTDPVQSRATMPVKKGDRVYMPVGNSGDSQAAFYKLRDYTGR